MMRRLMVVLAVAMLLAGCSSDGDEAAVSEPAESTVTLAPRTPEPSSEQAAEIEAQVAVVYPGVPDGKAADWARSVCSYMLQDPTPDEGQVVERVVLAFAGGDRPDPTLEQAAQILEVIRADAWCVAG